MAGHAACEREEAGAGARRGQVRPSVARNIVPARGCNPTRNRDPEQRLFRAFGRRDEEDTRGAQDDPTRARRRRPRRGLLVVIVNRRRPEE